MFCFFPFLLMEVERTCFHNSLPFQMLLRIKLFAAHLFLTLGKRLTMCIQSLAFGDQMTTHQLCFELRLHSRTHIRMCYSVCRFYVLTVKIIVSSIKHILCYTYFLNCQKCCTRKHPT